MMKMEIWCFLTLKEKKKEIEKEKWSKYERKLFTCLKQQFKRTEFLALVSQAHVEEESHII